MNIIYSSVSGNTKKLAMGLFNKLNLESINEIPYIPKNNSIIIACWIDKGFPDSKTLKIVSEVENRDVFIFATLAASPDSKHGEKCIENIKNKFSKSNILGVKLIQGSLSNQMIEYMESLPKENIHYLSDEKRKRYKQIKDRPNQNDIDYAASFINNLEVSKWKK